MKDLHFLYIPFILFLILSCRSGSSGDTIGVDLPVDPISVDNSLKPATLPTYASLNLYNANNPFNKLIGSRSLGTL